MLLTPRLYRKILEKYKEDKSVHDVEFETYLCNELKRITDLRRRIKQQQNAIRNNDKLTESMKDELDRMLTEECPHYMFTVETVYEDKTVVCDLCGAEL